MLMVSKKLIAKFEIKYSDFLKLALLKRIVSVIFASIFIIGMITAYILMKTNVIRITQAKCVLYRTIYWIFVGIMIVVVVIGAFKGYRCFWGSSEAYLNDDKTITFIGRGRIEDQTVTIRANEIEEFHGFYCLKENYFRYVFVPLDFPINEIPVSSIKKVKNH